MIARHHHSRTIRSYTSFLEAYNFPKERFEDGDTIKQDHADWARLTYVDRKAKHIDKDPHT